MFLLQIPGYAETSLLSLYLSYKNPLYNYSERAMHPRRSLAEMHSPFV